MPLSHRVVVLDHGEKLTEGPPAEVARDERVITAYLGDRYRGRALAPPGRGRGAARGARRPRGLRHRRGRAPGRVARGAGRRGGGPGRGQRRGQDHAAQDHRRAPVARGAARSGSTAAASTTSRRRTASTWASRSCPRAGGSSAASPSPRTCASAPSATATRSAARRCSSASSGSSRCCGSAWTSARARSRGGEGQMLSIARALMSRPRFLMLDEPSLGIMPRIVDSILDVLQMLHRQEGLTVLLVEQNVPAALAAARARLRAPDRPHRGRGHEPDPARQRPGAAGLSRACSAPSGPLRPSETPDRIERHRSRARDGGRGVRG